MRLNGASLIAAERQRQIDVEGYSIEHDLEHGSHTLRLAARAYHFRRRDLWPWDREWWKPKDRLTDLVRAGALYQATADVIAAKGLSAHWTGAPGNPLNEVEAVAAELDAILASPVLADLLASESAALRAEAWHDAIEVLRARHDEFVDHYADEPWDRGFASGLETAMSDIANHWHRADSAASPADLEPPASPAPPSDTTLREKGDR